VEIKKLYKLPNDLLGVPETGVYIILNGCEMYSKVEKGHWNEALDQIENCELTPKVRARFFGEASSSEYSGRRKDRVFKAELKVVSGDSVRKVPDWLK